MSSDAGIDVRACLTRLEVAIDAAHALGLPTEAAQAVLDVARQRVRFPGHSYVLALAGGTGVGKSSILNGLAGATVSASGVRRPTTSEPVGWVPSSTRSEVEPLLSWLGVRAIREHTGPNYPTVVVIDLPDLDSIAPEHRARVDELLPRIDAVLWVTDPEKYADAILHDAYLRRWGPRIGRQAVLLNKSDRLSADQLGRLRRDLEDRLRGEQLNEVPVLAGSAIGGVTPSGSGLHELDRWLSEGAAAKEIIVARLGAEVRNAVGSLAASAGVDGTAAPPPLLTTERRSLTSRDVTRAVLGIVDLTGLERQAMAATRQQARPRGGGPLGWVTGRLYQWSGRERAVADPAAYLRRWRTRGSLSRTLDPVRQLTAELLPRVPPAARPAIVSAAEAGPFQARLAEAVDRAVGTQTAEFSVPRSIVWTVLGVAQSIATGALVLGVIWLLALALGAGGSPMSVEVPILGPVPAPVLLVTGALVVMFLLNRVLAIHAGWVGRRWARRLRAAVGQEVGDRLDQSVFAPLEALEAARQRLAAAGTSSLLDCR